MTSADIKAGEWYLAKAGNWIYDVEAIDPADHIVQYTVLQTGQKCQCHVAHFAGRVERKLP